MKTLTSLACLVPLATSSVTVADVLINEVHINPPGSDDAGYQYIEILSVDDTGIPEQQTLGNLSIVFVDSNGGNVGNHEESLNLNGLQTGTNGLLLIGQGFDGDVPWEVAEGTELADFNDINGANGRGDIGPKDGPTILLVEGLMGGPGTDMDANDDGVFNRNYWTNLLDSVGFGDQPYITDLEIDITPDNISRLLDNRDPNQKDAWYGGNINEVTGPLDLNYDNTTFGFSGAATPGRPNLAPPTENLIRINEVLVNPPGEDQNFEFIELISTTGTFSTTNGLWLLVVDSDLTGNVVGEVLEAWDLNGFSTGANGLLVLGQNYRRSSSPWKDIIEKDTEVADPPGFGNEDIGSNDGFTLLLVRGFTGTARIDTTPGTDLDPGDTGEIALTPWDTSEGIDGILDSIGFAQLNVAGDIVQESYAPASVTQSGATGFHPDAIARLPSDLTPNSAGAWLGGDIGGNSPTGIAFNPGSFFGPFRGDVTPGQPNRSGEHPQSLILFNEVHLDPVAEPDGAFEYIELVSPTYTSTPIQNLSLLIVDVNGAQKGEITDILDLRGLSTGSRGLLVLGDGYDTLTPYEMRAGVHYEDPQGLDVGDIGAEDNESMALLLVENFVGTRDTDIDTDDDGTFDQSPWDVLADSLVFGPEFVQTNGIANLNSIGFTPDSISRFPDNLAQNASGAWFGATLAGTDNTSLVYDRPFGPYRGQASPGALNVAAPVGNGTILINEVHVNPPGNDNNFEYIELLSTSGTRQSTNGLTLLMVETSGTSTGEIVEAWDLNGLATGTNGLLLLGNNYTPSFTASGLTDYRANYWDETLAPTLSAQTPFGESVNSVVTAAGDPPDLGNDNIGDNNSFSLLLVREFTGTVGDDLDADDDGDIDDGARNWNQAGGVGGILDSVGIREFDDVVSQFTGSIYALADVGQEGFAPDNISRRADNVTPNSTEAWYGGEIAGTASGGLAYSIDTFGSIGDRATPGMINAGTTGNPDQDDDGDGQTNEAEAIAGTDPLDPTDYLHFVEAERTPDSIRFTWSSVAGKNYDVEYSESLTPGSWEVISTAAIPGLEGITSFEDTDAERTSRSQGYYRVRVGS